MTYKTSTSTGDETIETGKLLGKKIRDELDVPVIKPWFNCGVLLYGEMGAGKTHFVKGLALGLGVRSDVTSPTFALVNDYEDSLFHFDLFRLESTEDLFAIGFFDYLGKEGVIAVEWCENVPEIEKEFDKFYKVEIEKEEDEKIRLITIHEHTWA
jgi:tRNA threonylcarbamoyladenosine biosynthesis protein TsaE